MMEDPEAFTASLRPEPLRGHVDGNPVLLLSFERHPTGAAGAIVATPDGRLKWFSLEVLTCDWRYDEKTGVWRDLSDLVAEMAEGEQ